MTCNCNNSQEETNTIQFIKGVTVSLTFNFDEDISTYTDAEFKIAKDYQSTPVIDKTISITENNKLDIELTPADTDSFSEFLNGKNSAVYLWSLDLIDSVNNIKTNVFPKTGTPAPLCIVYKHV